MSAELQEQLRELQGENRQLRDHLEFLRSILESTDDPVFARDREGRHWLANRSAARVVGRPLAEMLGRTAAELFPPEVAARIDAFDKRVMESSESLVLEQEFEVEGSRRTYLTKKAPYRNRQGVVMGLVGIGRDITERKRAEEALQRRSAELTERVKELQCLYSLSTVMGQPDLPLVDKLVQVAGLIPSGWKYPEAARARISVGERSYSSPGYRDTPWLLSHPLEVRGQRVGEVEVVYLDERPAADEGPFVREELLLLREVATRLEELLERRRVAEELTRARERAEAASRLKSEFVTNISHELRTPMNSILGFTELLIDGVDGPLNAAQHGSLWRVERNARNLLRLINEVLDLSRIESGRMELSSEPFSLREMVVETARELQVLARAKGLSLEYRIAAAVPDLVCGDEARLHQVLLNLGENAVKFTAHGGVEIQVEPGEKAGPGEPEVLVRVRDTGIGVPEGYHRSVFEPFVQVDGSSTRCHQGAGLGLAICSHLVQLMGGQLWLESEEGRGSVFLFTVPLGSWET